MKSYIEIPYLFREVTHVTETRVSETSSSLDEKDTYLLSSYKSGDHNGKPLNSYLPSHSHSPLFSLTT